ncbi:MAG: nucleoside triphosphate pyrophosphohydrolase [Ginsengibacter sp.]
MSDNISENFLRLVSIMNTLRNECPWDKKQTFETLRQLTIEEVYELTDAITSKNYTDLKEELGDVLLHIIFYSKIAEEERHFTLAEVIDTICEKLIKRHPHIYGDTENNGTLVSVKNDEDVKRNWEQIKLNEGKQSVLSGVPKSLPALIKAMRIQEKAKQVGFEWENKEQVWEKIIEEQQELKEAVQSGNQQHIEEEMGDLLFSIINYSRFLKVDAEQALSVTNNKFVYRFTEMEKIAKEKNLLLSEMSLTEMDDLWNAVKTKTSDI